MTGKHHPDGGLLALCAGGDLPLIESLRVRWHVRRCGPCAAELGAFAAARAALKARSQELPEGLEWSPLAAEMTANIHLGLSAGEAVDHPSGRRAPVRAELCWRRTAAVVVASFAFVMVGGWLLNRPGPGPGAAPGVSVAARGEGLVVARAGSALTLLGPSPAAAGSEVDFGGSARARYVDAETGQVTIHHVYAD
jgi:hypothetical protein